MARTRSSIRSVLMGEFNRLDRGSETLRRILRPAGKGGRWVQGLRGEARPNLGMAEKTARVRERVQSSFLRRLLGFAESQSLKSKRIIEQERRQIREQLKGEVSTLKRAARKLTGGLRTLFPRITGLLGAIGARAAGRGDQALFTTPVSDLRTRPQKQVVQETERGAKMIGVSSSNVYSVGYDPDPDNPGYGILTIQFRSESRVYEYLQAPEWLYEGLLRARSPGRYVHDYVRQLYDHTAGYRRVA